MATINDVVLIYLEDSPVSFARVESILPDPKKGWFQITLLMLQIPLQNVTWILRDSYINGDEFQMNGKTMRLETIQALKEKPVFSGGANTGPKEPEPAEKNRPDPDQEPGNIISFADLKKKNHGQDPA
jgi:hypothetical protein